MKERNEKKTCLSTELNSAYLYFVGNNAMSGTNQIQSSIMLYEKMHRWRPAEVETSDKMVHKRCSECAVWSDLGVWSDRDNGRPVWGRPGDDVEPKQA